MGFKNLPSKANTTAVSHAITKDLAGLDVVSKENGGKFLHQSQ